MDIATYRRKLVPTPIHEIAIRKKSGIALSSIDNNFIIESFRDKSIQWEHVGKRQVCDWTGCKWPGISSFYPCSSAPFLLPGVDEISAFPVLYRRRNPLPSIVDLAGLSDQ
jgi:hypothetical protein